MCISGSGTNYKVCVCVVGGGHTSGMMRRKKTVLPYQFFGSTNTISRFGERFRDGQYSLVRFLFAVLLLTVTPCPAICKSRGHVPPCPMESAPLLPTNRGPTKPIIFYSWQICRLNYIC